MKLQDLSPVKCNELKRAARYSLAAAKDTMKLMTTLLAEAYENDDYIPFFYYCTVLFIVFINKPVKVSSVV